MCFCTEQRSHNLSMSWLNTKSLTLLWGSSSQPWQLLANQSGLSMRGHNWKVKLSITLTFIYHVNEFGEKLPVWRDIGPWQGCSNLARFINSQGEVSFFWPPFFKSHSSAFTFFFFFFFINLYLCEYEWDTCIEKSVWCGRVIWPWCQNTHHVAWLLTAVQVLSHHQRVALWTPHMNESLMYTAKK